MQSENKVSFIVLKKKRKENILAKFLLKIHVLLLHQNVNGFITAVMKFV